MVSGAGRPAWEVDVRRAGLLLVVLVLTAGCGWPRDAAGTEETVRGGVLRVGVTENPPWTRVADDGTVTGAEAALVDRLAERLGARVRWFPGAESALMAALRERSLDLVVGGLDGSAPWTEHASLTRPYLTTRTVVAGRPGVAVPDDLTGVRVAVTAGTADALALAGLGADVLAVPDLAEAVAEGLPVAVGRWRLDELGLVAADHDLPEHERVWAVPLGENGWQVEVERFLLDLPADEVRRLLADADRAGAVTGR
jgi:polar amino acid transport system substrate-binding protein